MIRTQIQLPDRLYEQAKHVAGQREISMAELVRRGLEYMIAISSRTPTVKKWSLPDARRLGGHNPFENPDWRVDLHLRNSKVAEPVERYNSTSTKNAKK